MLFTVSNVSNMANMKLPNQPSEEELTSFLTKVDQLGKTSNTIPYIITRLKYI